MARATHDDVSILALDTTSYLTDAVEGTVTITNRTVDGTVIGDTSDKQCIEKKSAEVSLKFSSDDGSCKVSGLHMSAATLKSIDVLDILQNLDVTGSNDFKETSGVSDEWEARTFVKQSITASMKLLVKTSATSEDDLAIAAASSTLSDANASLSFVLNSVTWTVPMVVAGFTHRVSRGDVQEWDISLVQRGAATSPAGTGSLLAKALNAPGTAQALELESKAAGGVNYAGNFVVTSFGFNVSKGDITMTNYTYMNDGALTVTAST